MTHSLALSPENLLECLSSAALVLSGTTGQIVYANASFFRLTGLSPESLPTLNYPQLLRLPEKTNCALCTGMPSLEPSEKEAFQPFHIAFLPTLSDEEMKVKLKHDRLPTGDILCLLDPFSEDITLTQAHSDFVSTVSHEFRTPLTSIKGFADTLLRYGSQLPADQQKRFINIIKDQADRLTRLVENLLTVSKLGASRTEMSYRPVSLEKIVEKVIQNLKAKHGMEKPSAQRNFAVEIQPNLPPIWADADKLEQILINLIDNAIKYSYPNTEVKVLGRTQPNEPDRVQILIEDQGVGIPAEHLPRIFTKFSRIDNPLTREVEGTGLGLYITHALTKAMDGNITLESIPEKGTTFTLDFPVASAERQAAYRRKLYTTSLETD